MAYKQKFLDSVITDAGRKILLAVGAGNGTLVYTRAVMTSQVFQHLDSQGNTTGMSDEDIRAVTSLSDELRVAQLTVSPVDDNTVTVSADFDNQDLSNDITFNAVGWFAKVNSTGTETLIAITPTAQSEVLAAGAPDHHSSQAILIDLNMAIANAANINMTVNQAGYVNHEELTAWENKIKADIDQQVSASTSKLKITINGDSPASVGSDGSINIDTMTSGQIKELVKDAGSVKSVNNTQPDVNGNVALDLSGKADASTVSSLQNTVNSQAETISQLNEKMTDAGNEIKQIKETALVGKHFTNEADAKTWEDQNPNGIAFIDSNS